MGDTPLGVLPGGFNRRVSTAFGWLTHAPSTDSNLYRRYCGQHTYVQGGAQEAPVLSQNKVLLRFVELIIDDLGLDRVQQRFEEQDLEASRTSLVEVWRGSGGAVLRRGQVSPGRHLPSVCDSLRRLLENVLRFSYVKVFSDPEVDSPQLLKIWIFTEPLISDSHLPRSRQLEALDDFHTFST